MNLQLKSPYDAIVIGSGHNGLVAAAYLAKAGKSVLLLEKNGTFGGATASKRVFPDYEALLSRYSYLVSLFPEKIIRDLDLNFKTRRRSTASFTPWRDSAGNDRGLVLSNVDEARSRDSMFELTGNHSGWNRYQAFLSLQSSIAKLIWPSMLRRLRSRASFESLLQTKEQKLAWRAFVERPIGEVIEEYADHDALRGLLLTDGKIGVFTHAHDPNLLQNRCFLYHVIGNETGQWRVPVGGMRSLVDSLVERCRSLGVQLLSNATALHIDRSETTHEVTFAAEGVEQSATARDVLVNAGPRTFARLLHHPWKAKPEDEGSVIKINMLLKRLPRLMAAGTSSSEAFCGSFHIDEGYEQLQSSYRSASQNEIPSPAPGEVYCHTLTDSSILSEELQQRGFHTLTLFGLDMPWRLFESDHDGRRSKVLELYLKGLNNLCDEPFEECLAIDASGQPCVEIKTPQDLQSEIDLDQGNIFHNALSWFYGDENQVGSWGVETEYPRIYRAGASALRGGAVSGIPGHNAAMCILQIES
jgi:phytoene dehydrogenase-like protein